MMANELFTAIAKECFLYASMRYIRRLELLIGKCIYDFIMSKGRVSPSVI